MVLAFTQLRTPCCEIPTIAPDQFPGFKVTVPRFRACTAVNVSGLTTEAVTDAFWVAAPPGAASPAEPAATTSINCRVDMVIGAFGSRKRIAFHRKWLIFGQPWSPNPKKK